MNSWIVLRFISVTSPFTEIHFIGIYLLWVIFTIVHMELVMPINISLALLIHCYSEIDGAGKATSVCDHVLAI